MTAYDGFLCINKPSGMTSRAVVDHICRIAGTRRVGHAGTLDPLACGVLVVAVGRATRLIEFVQQMPKTYEAEILLGATSDTDDIEGNVVHRSDVAIPDGAAIAMALRSQLGEVLQQPPAFSALKVSGVAAYRLARKGQSPRLRPRLVVIHSIEALAFDREIVRVRIVCGCGVYIRAIARDLGEQLGTGGVLTALRRTQIGRFGIDQATALDRLDEHTLRQHRIPMTAAIGELPQAVLGPDAASRFRHGQSISWTTDAPGNAVAVFTLAGDLIGIGRLSRERARLEPIKGLTPG